MLFQCPPPFSGSQCLASLPNAKKPCWDAGNVSKLLICVFSSELWKSIDKGQQMKERSHKMLERVNSACESSLLVSLKQHNPFRRGTIEGLILDCFDHFFFLQWESKRERKREKHYVFYFCRTPIIHICSDSLVSPKWSDYGYNHSYCNISPWIIYLWREAAGFLAKPFPHCQEFTFIKTEKMSVLIKGDLFTIW